MSSAWPQAHDAGHRAGLSQGRRVGILLHSRQIMILSTGGPEFSIPKSPSAARGPPPLWPRNRGPETDNPINARPEGSMCAHAGISSAAGDSAVRIVR